MIVSFPFTFSFSVPGLPNPFSPNYSRPESKLTFRPSETGLHTTSAFQPSIPQSADSSMVFLQGRPQISPSPSFTNITNAKSLKRGWEPAFAEPSRSTTTLALTSGYLDNPSKYREMANATSTRDQPVEELPPACKKRRGLAGSIVSTAVSAALIGTAVGLTVYRLWRGRGKEQPKAIAAAVPSSPEFESGHSLLPPPPPYQEREWSPASHHTTTPHLLESSPALLPTPTPRKKVARHSVKRTRRARIPRTQALASPPRVSAVSAAASAVAGPSTRPQPEFDFGRDEEPEEDSSDQMDWIQGKLAQLIEEGKRALNREVVVMSDAKEDEFDDGTGVWEEEEEENDDEEETHQRTSVSRAGSLRRKRSRHHVYGSFSQSSHHLPTTPAVAHTRGFSSDSVTSLLRENDNEWQSPELRESMQKARERILASRMS